MGVGAGVDRLGHDLPRCLIDQGREFSVNGVEHSIHLDLGDVGSEQLLDYLPIYRCRCRSRQHVAIAGNACSRGRVGGCYPVQVTGSTLQSANLPLRKCSFVS